MTVTNGSFEIWYDHDERVWRLRAEAYTNEYTKSRLEDVKVATYALAVLRLASYLVTFDNQPKGEL